MYGSKVTVKAVKVPSKQQEKTLLDFHSQELAYKLLQGTHMGRVEGERERGEES